jgi:HK97 family phage prohead protease
MSDLLVRRFDAHLAAGDGRTIIGRCVPYDVTELVADPGVEPYREVWRSGAFRHVLKAPHLVRMVYEHDDRSIMNVIGHAVELTESADGLEGTFRAVGAPGDQALELIEAGTVAGLSVAVRMHQRGSRPNPDGVVERIRVARLEHVALTGAPAYAGATVTAVRSAGDPEPETPAAPALEEVLDWSARARARFTRS